MGSLSQYDRDLAALQARFPGWRIWYVPRAKEHGGTIWCAQPGPLINTDSPDHLAQEIQMAKPASAPESDSGGAGTVVPMPVSPWRASGSQGFTEAF
jgi:hypothetical protein